MPIDRHALATRHNVMLTQFDGERPLQVGNGWDKSPLPIGTTVTA